VTANLLLTLLSVAVAAAPFVPFLDQPRQSAQIRLDAEPSNLLLTTLAAPAAVPVVPYVESAPRPVLWVRGDEAQNLLLTTLGTTRPFVAVTEETRPAIHGIRPDDTVNRIGLLTSRPFAIQDVQAPATRGVQPSSDPPNLLVTTLAAPAAAPFTSSDWIVMRPVQPWREYEAPNLILTTLAPVVPRPAIPTDWSLAWPIRRVEFTDPPNILVTLYTPTVDPTAFDVIEIRADVGTIRIREDVATIEVKPDTGTVEI
jgi:hypothetical protein